MVNRIILILIIWMKSASIVFANDARQYMPHSLICFETKNKIQISWLEPPGSIDNVDHYRVKITTSKADGHTYEETTSFPFYSFINHNREESYGFSVRAVLNDGFISDESDIIRYPKDQINKNILYAKEGETISFRWTLNPGFRNPSVKTRAHNRTLFTINTKDNTISSVLTPSVEGRIRMGSATSDELSFQLQNVSASDGDYYTAVSTFNKIHGGQLLIVAAKPDKPTVSLNTTVIVGLPLNLTCLSGSNSKPEYHGLDMSYFWLINGTNITGTEVMDYLVKSDTLVIKSVKRSDKNTTFVCYSKEENGLISDASQAIVDPLYGPDKVYLNPSNSTYVVIEGNPLPPITCSADCNPSCKISWQKYNESLKMNNVQPTLTFLKVNRTDGGKYECVVRNPGINSAGNLSKQIEIMVQYKAKILGVNITENSTGRLNQAMPNISFTFSENDKIDLRCRAEGQPLPDMTWIKGNNTLDMIKATVYLNLTQQAECYKTGTYQCVAQNNIGNRDTKSVRIYIKCQPRFLNEIYPRKFGVRQGEEVIWNTTVVAYPQPKVELLSDQNATITTERLNDFTHDVIVKFNTTKDSFKTHEVKISNGFGESRQATFTVRMKDIPVQPSGFKAQQISSDCLQVSWTSMFNGGEDQTFFLQYYIGDDSVLNNKSFKDPGENKDIRHCVVDFLAGTRYRFTLYSQSSIGSTVPINISFTTTSVSQKELDQADNIVLPVSLSIGGGILVFIIVLIIVIFVTKRKKKTKDSEHHERTEVVYENANVNPLLPVERTTEPGDIQASADEYAEVIKPKRAKQKAELSTKGERTTEPGSIAASADEYAEVIKPKRTKQKVEQSTEGERTTEPGSIAASADEYAEVIKRKRTKQKVEQKTEGGHSSSSKMQDVISGDQSMNPDGIIYLEVDTGGNPSTKQPGVIHGAEDRTEYMSVDFIKTAELSDELKNPVS